MTFYNVPIFPGVPPVLRAPNFSQVLQALLAGDADAIIRALSRRPWGLYKNGLPVIIADAVRSLDVRADQTISTYPVEPNAFASYNKVRQPYNGRIRYMTAGSEAQRRIFLESVLIAHDSLETYDLVMPEFVYAGVNVTHYDLHREASKGLGLLTIDVWCEQVRETVTTEFTQTQSASASGQQNGGAVQSAPASTQLSTSVLGGIY